ncbi:ATP-grasp fold amidoligase family protein [Blastococcus deserti]|uniref:ATP-grasp fold amidoligase family protein n=1 Tax=Blastococcus deserti TaxID=2259033 RepID=A0ABW4X7M4_9ACTN
MPRRAPRKAPAATACPGRRAGHRSPAAGPGGARPPAGARTGTPAAVTGSVQAVERPSPAALPARTAVAEVLGREFDFIRVDLYDVDGAVWFGEPTPCPGGGLDPFDPGLDRELGAAWVLPPLEDVRPR